MKYNFRFSLLVVPYTIKDEIIEWCNESFDESRSYDDWQRSVPSRKPEDIEKDNELRWSYIESSNNSDRITVMFRDKIDAMAFRLRWAY